MPQLFSALRVLGHHTVMKSALARALTEDPDAQALLGALAKMRSVDRFYALPPGTPDELVSHVRGAFPRTMADPVFRQNAARARLSIDPMSGEEVSAGIAALLALPDETRDRLAQIVDPVSEGTEGGAGLK